MNLHRILLYTYTAAAVALINLYSTMCVLSVLRHTHVTTVTPAVVSPSINRSTNTNDADAAATPLPVPNNNVLYTKQEAAHILSSRTNKRTRDRVEMVLDMVDAKYIPPNINVRYMQKLMKTIADGEEIVGDWPGTTTNIPLCGDCNGIQSSRLINFVLSSVAGAYKYATDQGWNIQNNNWHASGCTNNDVDNNGRCLKCRSAKNNMNQARHPIMFQEEDSVCSTIVPIDNDIIRKGIKDRLNVINKSGLDVSTDNALQHAARLLRINNSDGV